MPPFDFVGPYEVGEKLGQGGMGSVYKAVHAKTSEPVAVKIIAAPIADEPRFRRRFDAEIKTLMSLQHEGIVKLIGFGEEHGQLFYSMELVEGDSLQTVIKREKKLPWEQCIDYSIQICAALKHAHDVGVIHRDLKPANLILTSSKQLKLVDFGIAKIFGDEQQTVVGSLLGTLDYMAPEQLDSSSITVRTDLYAVGSLMYTMLTGRPPFRGKSAAQVIDLLKNQIPTRLDVIDPDLPEPLVEIVDQLLAKRPDDRPPTALSVSQRLKSMRIGLEKLGLSSAEINGPSRVEPSDSMLGMGETQPTIPVPDQDTGLQGVTHRDGVRGAEVSGTIGTLGNEEMTLLGQSAMPSGSSVAGSSGSTGHSEATRRQVEQTVKTSPSEQEEFALAPELQTHFQEAESARRTDTGKRETNERHNPWTQRFAVVGLVLLLAFTGKLLVDAMRPPTADQLYQEAAYGKGQSAQRAFIKNFPDDPRAVEVEDRLMLSQLEAAAKRISAQQNIGIKELTSSELAFVDIINGEDEAGKREASLRDWITAFGETDASTEVPALSELVSYELRRLESRRPDPRADQRLTDLIQQLEVIRLEGDSAKRKDSLQSLINLFEDESWAQPAIEQAKTMLER